MRTSMNKKNYFRVVTPQPLTPGPRAVPLIVYDILFVSNAQLSKQNIRAKIWSNNRLNRVRDSDHSRLIDIGSIFILICRLVWMTLVFCLFMAPGPGAASFQAICWCCEM